MSISKNRLLALLLSVLMLLSCAMLTACGKSRDDDDDDDDDDDGEARVKSTWQTPIELDFERSNRSTVDVETDLLNAFDGLGREQLRTIYSIVSSSHHYRDMEDDYEDSLEDRIESYTDDYGDNWKYEFEVDDKDELDEDDLEDAKTYFTGTGKELARIGQAILDLDDDDLEDMASDMGLQEDDLKELAEALSELGEVLQNAELSEGYDVYVDYTIKGDEDEDFDDMIYTVVKADRVWVACSNVTIYSVMNYLYMIGFSSSYIQ